MKDIAEVTKNLWYVAVGWGIVFEYSYLWQIDLTIIQYYSIYDYAKALIVPFVGMIITVPIYFLLHPKAYKEDGGKYLESPLMRNGPTWPDVMLALMLVAPVFFYLDVYTILLFPFVLFWDKLEIRFYRYLSPVESSNIRMIIWLGPLALFSAVALGLDTARSNLMDEAKYKLVYSDGSVDDGKTILRKLENHIVIHDPDQKFVSVVRSEDVSSWHLVDVRPETPLACRYFGWCPKEFKSEAKSAADQMTVSTVGGNTGNQVSPTYHRRAFEGF